MTLLFRFMLVVTVVVANMFLVNWAAAVVAGVAIHFAYVVGENTGLTWALNTVTGKRKS